jgi:hypothetical protein
VIRRIPSELGDDIPLTKGRSGEGESIQHSRRLPLSACASISGVKHGSNPCEPGIKLQEAALLVRVAGSSQIKIEIPNNDHRKVEV